MIAPEDLTGKIAVVTGAARGQGRSHALMLAEAGADIAVCDIARDYPTMQYPMGSEEDLAETEELLEATGRRWVSMVADTSDSDSMAAFAARAVAELGVPDILVANAGTSGWAKFVDISDREWVEMIDSNLTGTFKSVRAFLPQMIERQTGRIVATSSMGGRQGLPNLAHYAAAKFGIIGLVKSLALEMADQGITVNAVCPTNCRTPMGTHEYLNPLFLPGVKDPTPEQIEEAWKQPNNQPIPWIEPEDVSRMVFFLAASPTARYITGSAFDVGLGKTADMP